MITCLITEKNVIDLQIISERYLKTVQGYQSQFSKFFNNQENQKNELYKNLEWNYLSSVRLYLENLKESFMTIFLRGFKSFNYDSTKMTTLDELNGELFKLISLRRVINECNYLHQDIVNISKDCIYLLSTKIENIRRKIIYIENNLIDEKEIEISSWSQLEKEFDFLT